MNRRLTRIERLEAEQAAEAERRNVPSGLAAFYENPEALDAFYPDIEALEGEEHEDQQAIHRR